MIGPIKIEERKRKRYSFQKIISKSVRELWRMVTGGQGSIPVASIRRDATVIGCRRYMLAAVLQRNASPSSDTVMVLVGHDTTR
ncbi:hypothetical protein PISMIDRAFT_417902 [Pisolithus microcarpus 441]|uniref:Uncharacterized protein n=1 Tax=Pisolithus microcarpus 441 TaxID=765257 RepID=A0A0C9YYW4_9AGAM|nr:hypothetical protein BKA83DRAFT_417902 [Pisolithus microcarpus]KIK13043.1 hypothetical protein PISMIDRAFT_417902 [Pisolithus microcarpus 441]